MIDAILLLAGAVLLLSTRTTQMLVGYVVLAISVAVLVAPAAIGSTLSLVLFSVTALLKVAIAPLGILAFVRANPKAGDLRPSLAAPVRLLLVVVFALVAHGTVVSALGHVGLQSVTIYIVLCGVGILIVHRNLLSHVIGLLVLGTGVTLAGALLAPTLPASVELGATFDALVATFIGLALVRAFFAHNPMLDVDALRKLRG
ncbi:MAG TPA: NADH-quinone oxidoreductase subunit K [Candidatus Baltobacteraceae bacterium]|jgi:hydrogenase-4 membrane subunit HyfE|nr:NADH-quinone oxidoreductase subunit K [Candidatus Baltobacteraceae bacterium]